MPRGVYVRTEETKQKISESLKGHNVSEKTRNKQSELMKGRKLTEEHKRKIGEKSKGRKHTEESKKKMSEGMKGRIPWNKGLTKESDERIKIMSEKVSKNLKGGILSEEHKKKIGEGLKGRILSKESRQKISDSLKGHSVSKETRIKLSKAHKGKQLSEEHKRKIGEAEKGEKHWNWNPNREDVYAPYGVNFYNNNIRDRKYKLQNSRDMLTGTKLDPDKRPAYHHIDYCKSNDDPDNHCFLSINNHSRITSNQKNPIKSERYKKILQENTQALKNGEIPKKWSQINKELFRQEKLKQLHLSLYI